MKHREKTAAPISDEQIIELYWERNEQAIKETDRKYKRYLFSVIRNILSDLPDCEECLNDTYLGAWNSIPPARPLSLKAFLTVIARRIAIKRYHSNQRKKTVPSEMQVSLSELEGCIFAGNGIESELHAEELGRAISEFVSSLSQRRQFIFMSRYYVADPIDRIAKDLGLSRSMINRELAAIKSALKEKLIKEGFLT
jgi:RNA polymerase sigma-70 factor (ECF subfamily)